MARLMYFGPRLQSILVLLFLVIASALACSEALAIGASKRELVIGTTQEFETLNPLIMQSAATQYVSQFVNRSALVWLDADSKVQPLLAVRVPTLENGGARLITENSVEKIVADWDIVPNAVWADGEPIVAEDFKFSWQLALSGKVSLGSKEVYSQVEKIETDAKNPRKMTFVYSKAKFDYFLLPQFFALPHKIESKVWTEYGSTPDGYERNTQYLRSPTRSGLYNGPYLVTELKLGSHVVLSRNLRWYGKQPQIEKIVIKIIPSSDTLESHLLSGDVEMLNGQGFTLDQGLAFERRVKAAKFPYQVLFKDSMNLERIVLNLENPLFNSVRVRQAMLHAIDRKAIVETLFEGKQKLAHSYLSEADPWFDANSEYISRYTFSPRLAKKLLAEAGFRPSGKASSVVPGLKNILAKEGHPFSVEFTTTAGNKTREKVQALIQEALAQVGVEVRIRNELPRVFFAETLTRRQFKGMVMYAQFNLPENNPWAFFHSSSIPNEKNGWTGQNFTAWKNAKVDKSIEAMDTVFDAAKRRALAMTIATEYSKELPELPLFHRATVVVIPNRLKGVRIPPHLFAESSAAEDWYFEQTQ